MPAAGHPDTRLIIIRGNSASGKSTIAQSIRKRFGKRGLAIVGQDNLRRDILKVSDHPDSSYVGLIDLVARYALDNQYHVIVEGILGAVKNGEMLTELAADHRGSTFAFYLDVPFEETVNRHMTKPIAREFGEDLMRGWYKPTDLIPSLNEIIIPASSSLEASVELIYTTSGL